MRQLSRALTAGGLAALILVVAAAPASASRRGHGARRAHAHVLKPRRYGELDCNGYSRRQQSVHRFALCADVQGIGGVHNRNTWNGRFFDNGHYIGHDEPDVTFLSTAAGSGNDVTWSETLGTDPSAPPTVSTPGSDVTHYFELSVAPWFSMTVCDPQSYPQNPCAPGSDANAPTCAGPHVVNAGCFPGAGDALVELQFYPPGMAPFVDSISCDNTHWCSALTIDSLECNAGYQSCNAGCEEPVNFAFVQRNGVPTGPPSPQDSTAATFTQNAQTLMMNPGDHIVVHMWDAPVPHGGGHALEVQIRDLTTGQTGYMQASAANGFANTSFSTCNGTPFNFEPEYRTASPGNFSSWGALRTNVSTEFEVGHFTPCTSVNSTARLPISAGVSDIFYKDCKGPYETTNDNQTQESSDALCYPAGDTHGVLNAAPNELTGCEDNFYQNGDVDFDGSSYWADWPTGVAATSTLPGSFVERAPTSAGSSYPRLFIQTDAAYADPNCPVSLTASPSCVIPPPGPGAFYPYWSFAGSGSASCALEFGNVSSGVNNMGGVAQYGTIQSATLGAPEFEGPIQANPCASG
jgi:hypothetical protein